MCRRSRKDALSSAAAGQRMERRSTGKLRGAPRGLKPKLFNMTTPTPRCSLTGVGMKTPAASEECQEERAEVTPATRRWQCHLEREFRDRRNNWAMFLSNLSCKDRKCGRQKETRLPRQDVIRDASTSGGAETSRDVLLACAATSSRSRRSDTDEKYGCRDSA